MDITLKINDDVSKDELSYILRRLCRNIEVSGLRSFKERVFDSNGDPVGKAEIKFVSPKENK